MQAIFTVLGITPTADTRAIRRAYAQRLKTLDQHTQAGEFEALRRAYETALDWARNAGAAAEAQEPAAPAPDAGNPADPESAPQPPAALADIPASGYAPRQPQQTVRQVPRHATWRAARERRRIVDESIAELMQAEPQALPAAWKRLTSQPGLESLDAMADFGDRLLEHIAERPDGQYALYSLGQRQFHWEHAAYRPRTPRAAEWLQRYIEERELWERQPRKQRLQNERAIERMRRHPSPGWRRANRAHPVIYFVSRHMPLWWRLHVPAALARHYEQALQSPPLLVRGLRKLQGSGIGWPKWYVWIFVGILANGLHAWSTQSQRPTASQARPQQTQAAPKPQAPADQLQPITSFAGGKRAYRITGPVAGGNPNGQALLEVPIPAYPKNGWGARGTVYITLTVTSWGEVQAAVSQSSGSRPLDSAALAAAQGARVDGKLAYSLTARLPFEFRPQQPPAAPK